MISLTSASVGVGAGLTPTCRYIRHGCFEMPCFLVLKLFYGVLLAVIEIINCRKINGHAFRVKVIILM